MKIFFVGAGAIGSYLGAFLARAGHDVTLVDPWAEQVEVVRQHGIAVTGPHDPFQARPRAVHLNEAAGLPRDFEIAFVAMKAYDTAWATQLALRHLAADGCVVAAQNCWPDPVVASLAGASRAVGLIMSKIGVAVWKPGQVERGMEKGQNRGHDVFRVGEHDGRTTARATVLAEMLSTIDGALVTDNLWGERWSKLCANAMGNPVQAMSGLGSLDVLSSEVGRTVTIHLAAESARVGLALGYRIPRFNGAAAEEWADAGRAPTWEALDRMLISGFAHLGRRGPSPATSCGAPFGSASRRNWRASMAQDIAKGRSTEIDLMTGYVVAQGGQRGVPTPVSAAVVDVMHEVEAGLRRPEPANIALVLRRAGLP